MDKPLSPLARRIRDGGYKLTNARLIVLQVIEESHGHITSADIVERVAELDESIGRASVFRTLDMLTRLNIVRPSYIEGSQSPQYVLLHEGHHHHIVCTNCHQTIEFHDCGLDKMTLALQQQYNVEITGHLLEFYGLCENCKPT